MAEPKLLLPSLLFILACLLRNVSFVRCKFEEKKVLNLRQFQWRQEVEISINCDYMKSREEKGVAILEMKHRESCAANNAGRETNHEKLLATDEVNVRFMQSRMEETIFPETKDGSSKIQMPIISGVKLQSLNYIVTVGLGGRNMTVIVDTGSDLTWVQCEPCWFCYNQQEPLFNPTLSSSYKSVSCNSSTCEALQITTGNPFSCLNESPDCRYVVNYGDGSYTRGELGIESLRLGESPVDGFIFGCGRNNKGLFGGTSGLMGLGRSDLSVVSQTSSLFNGVFSYCLPSTEAGASGSLTMGGDRSVFNNLTSISYTRMVTNPKLTNFYFLNVTGISVGGVSLSSPTFSSGRFLIDSGTVITRLPPSIFKALETEFLRQFSGFPTAPSFSILNTCFNLSSYEEVNIPTIKFEFDGNAELVVDVSGLFYFAKPDSSQVCLAMASLAYETQIGIIGNYQQKNQRVVYDTKEYQLGFAPEICTFS